MKSAADSNYYGYGTPDQYQPTESAESNLSSPVQDLPNQQQTSTLSSTLNSTNFNTTGHHGQKYGHTILPPPNPSGSSSSMPFYLPAASPNAFISSAALASPPVSTDFALSQLTHNPTKRLQQGNLSPFGRHENPSPSHRTHHYHHQHHTLSAKQFPLTGGGLATSTNYISSAPLSPTATTATYPPTTAPGSINSCQLPSATTSTTTPSSGGGRLLNEKGYLAATPHQLQYQPRTPGIHPHSGFNLLAGVLNSEVDHTTSPELKMSAERNASSGPNDFVSTGKQELDVQIY